ncbi:MAG: ATP-binding protein [Candidatus Xenobiia bacterium LiM19]
MKLSKPDYFLSKKMGKAIFDYSLIAPGDRVLIGVSGGKDSLTLLRLLSRWRDVAPFSFHVKAVHVDMGGTFPHLAGQIEPVVAWMESHGYPYIIEKASQSDRPLGGKSTCFFCSWYRREALFRVCRKENYNKIALAHHMDDIVETVLLNLFFLGEISTMSASREMFGGKVTIIRPFAYVEEHELVRVARFAGGYPDLPDCPYAERSKRASMKEIIRKMERQCRAVKKNIYRSLTRIRGDYLLDRDPKMEHDRGECSERIDECE